MMFRQTSQLLPLSLALCLTTGCLSPIKTEVTLYHGEISSAPTNTNETKLLIYNDSSPLLYGLDGSGRINVKLDGKGVAQLNIHRYVQLITSRGEHEIDLVHRDLCDFHTRQTIDLQKPISFLEIDSAPAGNVARVVPCLLADFQHTFKPMD